MDEKKHTEELKQMYMFVWIYGYESKQLVGHVFYDVPVAMKQWKNTYKMSIFIFSSGLVVAQKLLFCNSTHGSLMHV